MTDLSRRAAAAILFALVILGAALRLHHLDKESFWLDEAYSAATSREALPRIVAETSTDVHPPLYYFVLHYWTPVAGDSERGSRLLSVCFSLAVVLIGFAVATRLFDRVTGLAAAALLTLSPFQIEFAQEARMYAMLAFLAGAATYALIRLFERPRVEWLALYVLAASLMTYTHIYSAFVLAAHGFTAALLALRNRAAFGRAAGFWAAGLALVLVLFVPWMSILATQTRLVQSGFWIPQLPWMAVFDTFLTYSGSEKVEHLLVVAAGCGGLLMLFTPAFFPKARLSSPLAVILPWLVGPIALPFLLSRVGAPIFLPKYTIAAAVPFAILAARGVTGLPVGRRLFAAAFVAWIGWQSRTTLRDYYDWPRKDDWRSAAAFIDASAEPGDVVYNFQGYNHIAFDYYLRRRDLDERPFGRNPSGLTPDVLAPLMAEDAGTSRRVWFVVLQYEPAGKTIAAAFERSFSQRRHVITHGIDLYLFVREQRDSAGTGSEGRRQK